MSNLSYVRTEMLDEQAPPPGQSGIILWLRTNLFSGWLNSIITVIALYFMYVVLSHMLPWFVNGIWTADSLTECREIRDSRGLETAACFAVIKERWNQLLFGFYPQELYWRAVLALVLLFVALSPVLFDKVPRKIFIFTLIYPFLLVFLIWGGSVWG